MLYVRGIPVFWRLIKSQIYFLLFYHEHHFTVKFHIRKLVLYCSLTTSKVFIAVTDGHTEDTMQQ